MLSFDIKMAKLWLLYIQPKLYGTKAKMIRSSNSLFEGIREMRKLLYRVKKYFYPTISL